MNQQHDTSAPVAMEDFSKWQGPHIIEPLKLISRNTLKVKRLHPDAILPRYATDGAACFDLHAVECGNQHPVWTGGGVTFRTGLAFEVPPGFVMQVFSRSGHGFKHDTRLANCVGIIDSDYRGEVLVRLTSDSSLTDPLRVNPGDRIAQAMLVRVDQWALVEVDELSDTARGQGGFGSTGV